MLIRHNTSLLWARREQIPFEHPAKLLDVRLLACWCLKRNVPLADSCELPDDLQATTGPC